MTVSFRGKVFAAALPFLLICPSAPGEDAARTPLPRPPEPLRIEDFEPKKLRYSKPDGGLPPALGVQSFQVFRACKTKPALSDGRGWTYHHHVDLARWKGRFYLAWNSCEQDEDTWPSRELYSTSEDGANWSKPAELFPEGTSTPLRMYFFRAPNGRMLVIAGLRTSRDQTREKEKGSVVVRELRADHSLGSIFTLRQPAEAVENQPLAFESADDAGFIEACRQLLADRVFLQQQDYGNLLDPAQRMRWNDPQNWPPNRHIKRNDIEDFGKAMAFFHRQDGALVGVGKRGWVTVSRDDGGTWSLPVRPESLVTGMGKVWGQRTANGHYALVFNPHKEQRFPLVIVTSDDGITFRDMRGVHGEVPVTRYAGHAKSAGASYPRGISEWNLDSAQNDGAMWIAYSSNKEDIWITRIPVPVHSAETEPVVDDFDKMPVGARIERWNTYSPKWAQIRLAALPEENTKCLQIEDRDPFDHARAVRLFPEARKIKASFKVLARQADRGALEIELLGGIGSARPVRLMFAPDGKLRATNGSRSPVMMPYTANRWLDLVIEADCEQGKFSVSADGKPVLTDASFAEPADTLQRLSFRSFRRPYVDPKKPVAPESDQPLEAVTYCIRDVRIEEAASR